MIAKAHGGIDWRATERRLIREGYGDHLDRVLPLMHEIDEKRMEKNAVLLAHYYQIAPIQMLADKVGDSLALAQEAKRLAAGERGRLIVSSTVEFMAEMVKLLNPDAKVVIPGLGASCSIAEGMNDSVVGLIRQAYPSAAIVGYINSRARTLASYDSACTSANARQIIERIGGDPVILVPDYFLARNVLRDPLEDGRTYLAYERLLRDRIVLHDPKNDVRYTVPLNGAAKPERERGTCIVHEKFSPQDVAHYRRAERVDMVLAHPEVRPDVAAMADYVGSTRGMIERVKSTDAKRLMVLSECNLTAPLRDAYPDRQFVTPCVLCPYMRKNTLEGVLSSLSMEQWEIGVPDDVAHKGRQSVERMLELTARR